MQYIVNWLKEQRLSKTLSAINGNLLDVGCGEGNSLCARYKQAHPDRTAIGIDVYPWNGVDQVIASSAELPFPDAGFDTVTCVAALNHIPERILFLKEAKRVLKPTGTFVMTMIPPLLSQCWHKIISPWDEDQSERGMAHEEVYGFTQKQVIAMLHEADFQIDRTERFIFALNVLYVARPVAA